MGIIKLYQGVPQHAAQPGLWLTLASALAGVARNRNIYLNELGEKPSQTPQTILSEIQQGAIWVDYCGYPMYGLQGASSFQNFLVSAGVPLPPGLTFEQNMPPMYGSGVTYTRELWTTSPLAYPFIPNPMQAPATARMITGALYHGYGSFAIRIGKGAYMYAYANDGQSYSLQAAQDKDFPVNSYIAFIKQIANQLPTASVTAGGSPPKQSSYPSVNAWINSKSNPISAINVDSDTYLSVSALAAYGVTPKSGASTVVYNGTSYALWSDMSPSLSASSVGLGSFIFHVNSGSSPGSSSPTAPSKNGQITGVLIAVAGIGGAWYLLRKLDRRR